ANMRYPGGLLVKEFTTDRIRNVCLAGQRGCGKTSLADAIAYCTGLNNRIGSVDDGSSLLDYTDAEITRKTSISSKLLAAVWQNTKINLLDCPGHADFSGERLSALMVADAVGTVVDASAGVEVGTQLQWNAMSGFRGARFFFVNKMELENAKWQDAVESIRSAFGREAVVVEVPIGAAAMFSGLVDLVQMKAYSYGSDGRSSETQIPAALQATIAAQREMLIEVAAEADDSLTEKFLEAGTLSNEELLVGLKKGIAAGKVFPVLFGSATENIGVQTLLDFIAAYLPAPGQTRPISIPGDGSGKMVDVSCDPGGKPLVYVFKTTSEGHLGEMSFFRVFSGTLQPGMELYNRQTRAAERVAQVYTFQGKNRTDLTTVLAGDIGVLAKLKNTHTGNTLGDANQTLTIPAVAYPNPVMDVAIKARSKGDEEKISVGLHKLHEEDPTFRIAADPALKQMVLYAQGSTHIEVLTEKLKQRYGVEVDLAKPKIPYRETVKGKTETQYRHKKQSGGRGQYGEVYIRVEPNLRGAGFEFLDEIKGGVIPSKYIPAVQKGIVEQMQHGGLAGAPVVDVKVALYYGSFHDVDSSDMAFKIAGLMAFKQGFLEAKPILLEPICNVEILVPDEFTGDVMGNLSSRRGKIIGMDPAGHSQKIRATVPQAELYQYSVDLRSMTQGQGVYSLEFSHYEEVPHEIAQKIIEQAKAEREAEA
ncbi:MAG TPA: elongation factor G, partial [Candidatus Deferrimicrobium sp.]|nr:elongation factor G [Candidatus Deferrimicrobium sp.]